MTFNKFIKRTDIIVFISHYKIMESICLSTGKHVTLKQRCNAGEKRNFPLMLR